MPARSVEAIDPGAGAVNGADALGGRGAVAIARQRQQRPGSDQAHHGFAVELPEQAGDIVVDPVSPERAAREQRLAPGEARHARGGRDPVVERREPPGAGAAHAHAGGGDPARVHLGARRQVVERKQVVADHHRPQARPLPQKRLGQAGFLVTSDLRGAAGSPTLPGAERPGIDGEDGVAATGERHRRCLPDGPGLEELVEPHLVLAPVRMVVEHGRPRRCARARLQQHGRNAIAGPVVEKQVLPHVRGFRAPADDRGADGRRARRRGAEQSPERPADAPALACPRRQRRRDAQGGWRHQRSGSCGARRAASGTRRAGCGSSPCDRRRCS